MDADTYLGTMLYHRIKEDLQCILFKPQCLRYKMNELVAEFLTLCKESQKSLLKARDVFLFVPLE